MNHAAAPPRCRVASAARRYRAIAVISSELPPGDVTRRATLLFSRTIVSLRWNIKVIKLPTGSSFNIYCCHVRVSARDPSRLKEHFARFELIAVLILYIFPRKIQNIFKR